MTCLLRKQTADGECLLREEPQRPATADTAGLLPGAGHGGLGTRTIQGQRGAGMGWGVPWFSPWWATDDLGLRLTANLEMALEGLATGSARLAMPASPGTSHESLEPWKVAERRGLSWAQGHLLAALLSFSPSRPQKPGLLSHEAHVQ